MKFKNSIITFVTIITATTLATTCAQAKSKRATTDSFNNEFRRTVYVAAGFDGPMVSINSNHQEGTTSLPRFTPILNTGVDVHYDPSTRFGFFAGLAVKNIGIKEKHDIHLIGNDPVTVTNKWRMYAIGIPVGFKCGNMKLHGTYCFAGAGVDAGVFYRSSYNNQQSNAGRYTGSRPIWPSIFAGACIKDKLGIKLQYYPTGNSSTKTYMPQTGSITALSLSWHLSNHSSYHPQVHKHREHK